MFFYSVYGSKYNKETLYNLKKEFTFEQVLNHKQFITIQEDLEREEYDRLSRKK